MVKKKIINLKNIKIGGPNPTVFILGPCQIENRDHSLMIAEKISNICEKFSAKFIFIPCISFLRDKNERPECFLIL